MSSYEGEEQEHWEQRIRQNDRYSSVGKHSLPNNINRYRKEALFEVINTALSERDFSLADATVLDAGCGTGIYSEFYAQHGADVYGVDISSEAVNQIQTLGIPGEYQQSGLDDLPFPDNHFDLVHVFSVLYHIVDDQTWKESLSELDRTTKPGGLWIMRIEWREEDSREADHLKHRAKDRYLEFLTEERSYSLEAVYPFSDVVQFQRLFIGLNMALPNGLAERISTIVDYFDLLKENRHQRVVVLTKGDQTVS